MVGLLRKDFLLIVRNLSPIYLLAFVATILPVIQNPFFLMPIISMTVGLFFAFQVLTTISLDEVANWYKNITAMPLSTEQEVLSKYLLSIILSSISALIVAIVGLIAVSFLPYIKDTLILYILLSFIIGLLYNSIIIPSAFRYGSSNCKFVLFIFVSLPTVFALIVRTLNIEINLSDISISHRMFPVLILLFIVIILSVSYKITVQIKNKNTN